MNDKIEELPFLRVGDSLRRYPKKARIMLKDIFEIGDIVQLRKHEWDEGNYLKAYNKLYKIVSKTDADHGCFIYLFEEFKGT